MPQPASSQKPSIAQLCDTEVDELDTLMAELRAGIRDQRHFDELEARADGICRNIRNAFRSGQR